MKRKDDREWLEENLKILVKLAKRIPSDGATTDYNYFTALKLVTVHYYATVFTNVVANARKHGYDGAVYVDLFAGTGLVRVKDSKFDDFVPGSPMCATLPNKKFDYVICVESVKKKSDVLKKRLTAVLKDVEFDVIHGDCNEKTPEIIDKIKRHFKNPILLVFVDPEGLEIRFSTLRELSENFPQCDFMVNVNSSAVKRVGGKIQKGISNVKDSLESYYDLNVHDVIWNLKHGTEPQEIYEQLIKSILGKELGRTIDVRDRGEKIAYHILGYTRVTRSQYKKAFDTLAARLDWADREKTRKLFDSIAKRQSSIDNYVHKDN